MGATEENTQEAAYAILRAYGCLAPTMEMTRGMVNALDRMGTFAPFERRVLIEAGILV